jgi:cardiolipin synthase
MLFNIPTIITLTRIALVPVIFWTAEKHQFAYFLPILILGALTDWLDGFLARAWQQTSNLGAILDPIADKIFICAWYFLFAFQNTPYKLPGWFVNFIFIKELLLIAGTLFLIAKNGKFKVVPSIFGKFLMTNYLILVFCVLQDLSILIRPLMYLIVALSIVVIVDYSFKEKQYV